MQHSRRWFGFAALACISGFSVLLISFTITPRSSDILPASIATAVPPTLVGLPHTVSPSPAFSSTITNTVDSSPVKLPTINTVTPTALPNSWGSDWLKGIPCRTPCWEDITPGKTTMGQALAIVQSQSFGKGAFSHTDASPMTGRYYEIIEWGEPDTLSGYISAETPTYLYTPSPKFRVDSIGVGLPTPIKLGDIISIFGQPTTITLHARSWNTEPFTYYLELTWKSYHFTMPRTGSGMDIGAIDQNVAFNGVTFTSPVKGFPKDGDIGSTDAFTLPWQGYKSFAYYCRAQSTKNSWEAEPNCDRLFAEEQQNRPLERSLRITSSSISEGTSVVHRGTGMYKIIAICTMVDLFL